MISFIKQKDNTEVVHNWRIPRWGSSCSDTGRLREAPFFLLNLSSPTLKDRPRRSISARSLGAKKLADFPRPFFLARFPLGHAWAKKKEELLVVHNKEGGGGKNFLALQVLHFSAIRVLYLDSLLCNVVRFDIWSRICFSNSWLSCQIKDSECDRITILMMVCKKHSRFYIKIPRNINIIQTERNFLTWDDTQKGSIALMSID